MIEKFDDEFLVPSEIQLKLNELIDASNRQDRAIGYMMLNHPKLWSELKRMAEENQTAVNDLAYWECLRG